MSAQYNAVTVSTTATVILAANNTRRGFVIKNNGSNLLYVGMNSSVSISNGLLILPQDSWSVNGDRCWRGAIYAVTDTSTDDIRFWEWEQ